MSVFLIGSEKLEIASGTAPRQQTDDNCNCRSKNCKAKPKHNTHGIARTSYSIFLLYAVNSSKYKTNGWLEPSLFWEWLQMERMSGTTDPTAPRCAGSCQLRSRHRVLRRPYQSRHGVTLERPCKDTAMSNTGEITSHAAAQRKALSTKKIFYAESVGKFIHIFSLLGWIG